MRSAIVERKTNETDIKLSISLGQSGESVIDTGCGFLNHMLTLFSSHSCFDIEIKATGDTEVDYHHTVEDIGIALGEAFKNALGDKKGIVRYADIVLPMDEALIMCSVDISGRSFLGYDVKLPSRKVGDFDTELVEEFWMSFVRNAGISMHIKKLEGLNTHHIIEGVFKACARVLKAAAEIDEQHADRVPSTKGVL